MADLAAGLEQRIDQAKRLGARFLVCASPRPPVPIDPHRDWVAAIGEAMTLDAWKANAAELARMAPVVAAAGLRFAYHNHPMEFRDFGGVSGYDILLGAVPADLLRLEIDLGWVAASGRDPVQVLKAHTGRVDLLHVKDMVADPAAPTGYRSVELGAGMIDWRSVFRAAGAAGIQGFFVEQEPPYRRPVLESLGISADYLRGI